MSDSDLRRRAVSPAVSSSLRSGTLKASAISYSSPLGPSHNKQNVIHSKKAASDFSGWITTEERDLFVLSTVLKLLLFPAYRSTDFEVHRNWLAITYSLPLTKWYHDTTSQWTLDYPPFFAYFEFLLSLPARLVDGGIVDLHNLEYSEWTVVAYQRITVILTELVLGAALLRFVRGVNVDRTTHKIIAASLFFHPGFLIIDHIHFQYNGFMFGILLWSILMLRENRPFASAFLFATLLCFKHIYVYLAPAYFIYLLRTVVFSPLSASASTNGSPKLPLLLQPTQLLHLAASVLLPVVLAFAPFILFGGFSQFGQILSRLFPFMRGLNHAYWAANVWALVSAVDRVLLKWIQFTGLSFPLNEAGVKSASRGLVGDTVFAVLPNVKPAHTFLLTLAFQGVFLVKLWRTPTYKSFLSALTLCGWTSFMFGWHVHEKAVLLILVPLSLMAGDSSQHLRVFIIASTAGVIGLWPLLFTPMESVFKILYTGVWCAIVYGMLNKRVYEFPDTILKALIERLEQVYLYGFIVLQGGILLHDVRNVRYEDKEDDTVRLEFLPLMMTSVYCAVGLVWAYGRFGWMYLVGA